MANGFKPPITIKEAYISVNEKIYKEFPKNGLSFPYPQMDIHVTK